MESRGVAFVCGIQIHRMCHTCSGCAADGHMGRCRMKLIIQNFKNVPFPWWVLDAMRKADSMRTMHNPQWLQVDEWCAHQWGAPELKLWEPSLGGWRMLTQDQAQLLLLTWGGAS